MNNIAVLLDFGNKPYIFLEFVIQNKTYKGFTESS